MSDESSFDLGEPPQPHKPEAYRVLARKYRPQTFSELIGQDAMVTTLGNAIKRDRLAHAFLLTGVRGVGKTSTARLIAKALNCIGPDGQGGPTIDPCGVCEPCRAIAEGRHIDVIEMDAASHTGIDDIREIIEASRYSAVSARYKIYIIDEVHMLSKAAFNGLLKTLEEPPAHVKFLFATTEVNKVPVTVLSRCQRFDLRRIGADKLAAHFAYVCEAEGVEAEPEALMLVARAAEGSARDGLSILDQAIAHAGIEGDKVRADVVRTMLGLSDRGAIRDLFGLLLSGDAPAALASLRGQYDLGVDPQAVLRTLLETVHATTLIKLGTEANPAQSAEEVKALERWAAGLSFPMLHRLWQLILRGHDEVARAVLPIEAAEMALLRVIHASQLPDPGELAKQIASGAITVGAAASPAAAASAEPAMPRDMAELAQHLETNNRYSLAEQVRHLLRPIRFDGTEVEFASTRPLPIDFVRELSAAMRETTGKNWKLLTGSDTSGKTLREIEAENAAAERNAVLSSPLVAAALEAFPDAELIGWTKTGS
ncbi:DNA polymerase III subunit gamma/tau [Sphingomonas sp. G-3-2-10]|uniref:DNA polymerase III subunit gamma/tau n=1 Tax=Sphingomonas sp. G-3-2-10 TaxID=2728838 RepID=UPI00146BFB4E|nr:DNA polymerase III subunit gamma/tau [Sphingomonas sp. G-3-2-10]NML04594.1 DNA polymerase III subunit gamma/tau [Sphingomonas sp. G-3-2-10]